MATQTRIVFRTPLGSEIIAPGPSSKKNLGPFDVSEYSAIRVYTAFNRGDSLGQAHVFVINTEMESEIGTDPGIAFNYYNIMLLGIPPTRWRGPDRQFSGSRGDHRPYGYQRNRCQNGRRHFRLRQRVRPRARRVVASHRHSQDACTQTRPRASTIMLQNLLLTRLGYRADGSQSEGRRLVFVGDLTDRGPDSPAVVRLVKQFVESLRAQCVLGNHDLNLLLCNLAEQHNGSKHPFGKTRKHDNHWFFGEQSSLDKSCEPTPAVLADDQIRQWVVDFLTSLPLVLERDDVRVVHACWDDSMVEMARRSSDTVTLYT